MRPIFFFLISAMLAAPVALADTASAQQAFKAGTHFFKKNEFEAAAKAFRKAYQEDPNWKILYNLGQCEAASRRYGLAMEAFEKYLALGGDEIDLKRRDEVETELDRLRRMVGFIDVSAPAGAMILLDGEERGTAPLAGKLMIAASVLHDLTVTLNGKKLLQRKVQVSGLQSISVNIVDSKDAETTTEKTTEKNADQADTPEGPPETSTDTQSPTIPASKKKRSPLIPVGIGLTATGGAALIAGVVTGAIALKRNKELADDCQNGCPDALHENNNTAWNLGVASNILLSVGGGIAATGLVLLIVGKRKHGNEKPVTIHPSLSKQCAGFSLIRSF